MIKPDLRPRPAGAPVPCALDRHLGPFRLVPELVGWMGTDWLQCLSCNSTVTRATASARTAA